MFQNLVREDGLPPREGRPPLPMAASSAAARRRAADGNDNGAPLQTFFTGSTRRKLDTQLWAASPGLGSRSCRQRPRHASHGGVRLGQRRAGRSGHQGHETDTEGRPDHGLGQHGYAAETSAILLPPLRPQTLFLSLSTRVSSTQAVPVERRAPGRPSLPPPSSVSPPGARSSFYLPEILPRLKESLADL